MDMNTARSYKISKVLLSTLILTFIFLINFKKAASPDLFYHLKMGKLGFESGGIVKTEQISYIKAGVRIYHFEWLGDNLLYLIYKITGYKGLVIFKASLLALIFYLFFLRFRQRTEHIYTLSFLILIMAYSLRFMAVEKPMIFTLLFISFLIFTLSDHQGKRVYLLPLLFLLWANIHPGVIWGILYFFTFLIGLLLESITEREKGWGWVLGRLLIIFIISTGATVLTPFGTEMFILLFKNRSLPDFIVKNEITILEIFRIPYTYLFYLFILLVILYNIRNIKKRYLFPFLFVLWLPYFYVNTVWVTFLFSVPVLSQVINLFYLKNDFIIQKVKDKAFLTIIFCSIPFIFAAGSVFYNYTTDKGIYGAGRLDIYYPASAIRFIKEHQLYGRWFNSIEFGGAIALESDKDIYPFIYSGTDFLSDIFNNYYKKLIKNPKGLINFLHETNVTGVIFHFGGEIDNKPLLDELTKNSFTLVYWDDSAIVLVNRNLIDEGFVQEYGLSINPYNIFETLFSIIISGQRIDEKLTQELYRSRERAMDSSKTHLAYGMALFAQGKLKEAENELRLSLSIRPDTFLTNQQLALLYEKLNNPVEAEYFKKRAEKLKRLYSKHQ